MKIVDKNNKQISVGDYIRPIDGLGIFKVTKLWATKNQDHGFIDCMWLETTNSKYNDEVGKCGFGYKTTDVEVIKPC